MTVLRDGYSERRKIRGFLKGSALTDCDNGQTAVYCYHFLSQLPIFGKVNEQALLGNASGPHASSPAFRGILGQAFFILLQHLNDRRFGNEFGGRRYSFVLF
jgi:hypothetical protein